MALKDWTAALADMDEVVRRQRSADATLQIKSRDVVEAMRLRAEVFDGLGQPQRAQEDRRFAEEWEKQARDDD